MDREFHVMGGKASGKILRDEAIDKYYENPVKCLECGVVIDIPDGVKVTEIRRRKFCSMSCSASYNDRKYVKRQKAVKMSCKERGKILRDKAIADYCANPNHCVECGIVIEVRDNMKVARARRMKFCSHSCSTRFHDRKKYGSTKRLIVDRRRKLKLMGVEYLGGECSRCGYNKCVAALEFHHRDPKEKDRSIRLGADTISWERMKLELDKCILLCSNCHHEIHDEMRHTQVT